jgi:hypothetical protein
VENEKFFLIHELLLSCEREDNPWNSITAMHFETDMTMARILHVHMKLLFILSPKEHGSFKPRKILNPIFLTGMATE